MAQEAGGATWGICTRRAGKLCSARSLLYRRLRLREWAHFLAFFAIYKIFTPSHRSGLKISAKFCCIFSAFLPKFCKILVKICSILTKFHQNFTRISHARGRAKYRRSSPCLPHVFPKFPRRYSVFLRPDALHCAAF